MGGGGEENEMLDCLGSVYKKEHQVNCAGEDRGWKEANYFQENER